MGYPPKNKAIKSIPSLVFAGNAKHKAPLTSEEDYYAGHHHFPKERNNSNIKIALIDSRSLIRTSFAHLLETSTPAKRRSEDFVVLPFPSTDEFLASSPEDQDNVHMIIFNIGVTCAGEDEGYRQDIQRMKREFPEIPLVILSERNECNCILEALRCGAHSYISTTLTPAVVIQAIRLFLVGGKFIPANIFLNGNSSEDISELAQEDNNQLNAIKGFTPRQMEVLHLLRKGKSNKFIAYELNMQEGTVKVHVSQIMKKLKAINRTHAAFLASQIVGGKDLSMES